MPTSPLPGIDSAGTIHRLLTGTSGALVVGGPGGSSADKLFGYSQGVAQSTTKAATAGQNLINGAAVPAGKVWVIDAISAIDTTSATTGGTFAIVNSVAYAVSLLLAGLAAGAFYIPSGNGPWVLSAGENVQATLNGCTLNDNLLLRVHGYEMNAT